MTIDDTYRTTAEVEADKIAGKPTGSTLSKPKPSRQQTAAIDNPRPPARAARPVRSADPGRPPQRKQDAPALRKTRHRTARAAVEAQREADQVAARAEAAAHTTGARYNALTVANRIETLGAEIRKAERNRDGSTRTISTWADGTKCTETLGAATGNYRQELEERVAELTDQLSYWQQIRAEQIAAGQATNHDPDTIAKGDAVKIRNRWYEVVRVNKKTVTVPSGMGSWTDTSPYREVQDHRPAGATATV